MNKNSLKDDELDIVAGGIQSNPRECDYDPQCHDYGTFIFCHCPFNNQ